MSASGVGSTTLPVLGGLLALLLLATVWRWGVRRSDRSDGAREGRRSLLSWAVLLALFAGSVHFGRIGIAVLVAAVAILALGEYAVLLGRGGRGRTAVAVASVLLPPLGLWMHLDWSTYFGWVAPAALVPIALLRWRRGPEVEVSVLGPLATLLLLSYVVGLTLLPDATNPGAGAAGWLVWTVVLTEMNDVAQAFWGRSFGRRKLAPVVSPNKTVEGLLGGLLTTMAIAVLLAPVLTPWPERLGAGRGTLLAVGVALVLGVAGLLGDLRMSTLKRHLGVKDSGRLVPGQGGILDRIDSLLFTAPLMFWVVWVTRSA